MLKEHSQKDSPQFPPLEKVAKSHLTTEELAYYSNRKADTWRKHACYETSPLRPVRVMGRLAWPTKDVAKMLGLEVA